MWKENRIHDEKRGRNDLAFTPCPPSVIEGSPRQGEFNRRPEQHGAENRSSRPPRR